MGKETNMVEYTGSCRTLQKLARTNITKSGFAFIEALGVKKTKFYVTQRRVGGPEIVRDTLRRLLSDVLTETPSLQNKLRDYYTEVYSDVYTERIDKERAIEYLLSEPFEFFDDMVSFCDELDSVLENREYKLLKVLIDRIREDDVGFDYSLVNNCDNYLSEISGYLDCIA